MKVALFQANINDYPDLPPFHPAETYPELAQAGIAETQVGNPVYAAVRQTLALLGLDRANFGLAAWNPLGSYIRPGDKVVLKPNFVLHEFGPWRNSHCLTTHGSIIRAMIDYAYLAAGPDSSISVADAPLQGAVFERIAAAAGLPQIQDYYWSKFRYELKVIDLRQIQAVIDEGTSFIKEVRQLPGDPAGYTVIDLAEQSRLSELDGPRTLYAVGDYDSAITSSRHNADRHQYVVSNTILQADAILSLPKLKTHNKVGLTVCLKNLIGIIGSKDCLPHHRYGKPSQDGDEFPDDYPTRWYVSQRFYNRFQGRVPLPVWRLLRSWAKRLLGAGTSPSDNRAGAGQRQFFPSGSWYGNDTIRRTVDDLNRIMFFYNRAADSLVERPQRRFFGLVDGIIAMEGNGPLRGSPKPCGLLLAGDDPLAIDLVAATLMGFDWRCISMLRGALDGPDGLRYSNFSGDESAVEVISTVSPGRSLAEIAGHHLGFAPPVGWRGYVEVSNVGRNNL